MLLGVAAAIVSLVVFFVTHSLVSTLIVVVMFAVTGVYAVRQPATKRYRISEDGVRVDAKFYPYSTFRSFSVMNEGAVNCVWLRPLQRYLPTIAMYFSDQDERSIVMTLENYLPAEDRSLDIVDRVLRKIRF